MDGAMLDGSPKINGNKIVCSGSVVINQNDIFEVYPIASDELFCIKFKIVYSSEDHPDHFDLLYEGEKTTVVSIARKFSAMGEFGTSYPVTIALEDDRRSEYALSFAVNSFGKIDKYTAVISYTFVNRDLTVEVD